MLTFDVKGSILSVKDDESHPARELWIYYDLNNLMKSTAGMENEVPSEGMLEADIRMVQGYLDIHQELTETPCGDAFRSSHRESVMHFSGMSG